MGYAIYMYPVRPFILAGYFIFQKLYLKRFRQALKELPKVYRLWRLLFLLDGADGFLKLYLPYLLILGGGVLGLT